MRVQSVIFQSKYCDECQLFYRSNKICYPEQDCITIPNNTSLRTDTYQNLFDEKVWLQYTGISLWFLKMLIKGAGMVRLLRNANGKEEVLTEIDIAAEQNQELVLPFRISEGVGYCYFEIQTITEIVISKAGYYTNLIPKRDVNLCILSCTYHRNGEINRNVKQLLDSDFFKEASKLYHHLRIIVSDNGLELEEKDTEYLKICHNPNTGGSGGFARCLKELRNHYGDEGVTNVIFMDDDVEFLNEALYRVFALLSYLKTDFKDSVIAGRMFRTDQRWVQYTAAEIWNAGDLKHIGLNQDMTIKENLVAVNDNTGAEYGGWWFCCFPYSFTKNNDPLPFFLHCDDVEYGLRYGGSPIILNGIHVWHTTYEYRQNPIISYYDMRNSMIVNAMYKCLNTNEEFRNYSMRTIVGYHKEKEYEKEYYSLRAVRDFLKGKDWFLNICVEDYQKKLLSSIHSGKYKNYFQQLYLRYRFRKKEQIIKKYQKETNTWRMRQNKRGYLNDH